MSEDADRRINGKGSTKKPATGSRAAKSKGSEPVQPAAGAVELSTLDRDELLQLSKEVEKALKSYDKSKRDEALCEMELVAQKHGIALKDVVQGESKRSVQVSKYKHPENPALTWSGRGRQAAWYKEAMEAGRSRDDLLVA